MKKGVLWNQYWTAPIQSSLISARSGGIPPDKLYG